MYIEVTRLSMSGLQKEILKERNLACQGHYKIKQASKYKMLRKPMLKWGRGGSIQDGYSYKDSKAKMKLTDLKVDPDFVTTKQRDSSHLITC